MQRYFSPILSLLILLSGCIGLTSRLQKTISQTPNLNDHFVGLVIYDPAEDKFIFEQNADRYFTPASNTKLFTYYAGLKLLEDSLVGLSYTIKGDSLIFRGTGDPTLLHPKYPDQPVFELLKASDYDLYWLADNFNEAGFGPGWSWDDYNYAFQPERSALPIYGNMVQFWKMPDTVGFATNPALFTAFTELDSVMPARITRDITYNSYRINPMLWSDANDTTNRPFKYSRDLVAILLADTLQKPVTIIADTTITLDKTIKSRPARPVFARMLQASDNFLAEQLLLNASRNLGKELKAINSIAYIKNRYLNNLHKEAIWVDGSGLSRYNLFTPRMMVQLLQKIADEVPKEELYQMLPAGGQSGTIKDWYKAEKPYVFAKTGTLSNNHSLSGYLETISGKQLIFSFMNNNYPGSSAQVKVEMEKVLQLVRDRY